MKVRFAVTVGSGAPDPDRLAAACVHAEKVGFDTIWMSDVPSAAMTEPLLGTAYAAAVTERVHLGVNAIPFGAEPYLVAHRLAQLDRLTGGRLLVTLVPGIDPQHPGAMMDEVVPQLRRLWAGGLPVGPVQDPLEIWLGGSGPKALARVGRLADGWLGSLVSAERAGEIVAEIQAHAAAAGRAIDAEHFGLSLAYARDVAALEAAGPGRRARPVPPELIPVGAAGVRRAVEDLVAGGLSKFVLRPVGAVADWADELDWLAAAVLPLQT